MRGSTLIAGHRMIGLSFDGYGVTGPDWGLSEMVFVRFPHKTLPPVPFSYTARRLSLSLFPGLLFSSQIYRRLYNSPHFL